MLRSKLVAGVVVAGLTLAPAPLALAEANPEAEASDSVEAAVEAPAEASLEASVEAAGTDAMESEEAPSVSATDGQDDQGATDDEHASDTQDEDDSGQISSFPVGVESADDPVFPDSDSTTSDSGSIMEVEAVARIPEEAVNAVAVTTKNVDVAGATAGTPVSGWQVTGGATYYVDPATGERVRGEQHLEAADGSGMFWYYFDRSSGAMVRGELYRHDDDAHTGWYCYQDSGAMTYGWKYLESSGGKWVYYDPYNGKMWYGEGYVAKDDAATADPMPGWCYFNEATGATQYRWKWLSSGSKWVYYDPVTGRMHHGESYVTGSGGDGWCYFDDATGGATYGWKYLSSGSKWVYYDPYTARMWHGEGYVAVDDAVTRDPIPGWCYFDDVTGATHYGWKHLADGRYVYYDTQTGRMYHGMNVINGAPVHLDEETGALDQALSAAIVASAPGLLGPTVDTLIADGYRAGRLLRVRILGDSISAGVGMSDGLAYDGTVIVTSDGNYLEGSHDYPIWSNELRSYTKSLFNASIPSKSLVWFSSLDALPQEGEASVSYDETIVLLGANDGEDSSEEFEQAACSVIAKAKQTSSHVLVMSPIPRREEGIWLRMDDISAILRRVCAEEDVSYLDLYNDFVKVTSRYQLGTDVLYWDLMHPTPLGQQVIWGIVRARLGL